MARESLADDIEKGSFIGVGNRQLRGISGGRGFRSHGDAAEIVLQADMRVCIPQLFSRAVNCYDEKQSFRYSLMRGEQGWRVFR